MTRKGKIARLPLSLREQINHRLENGEEAKQIATWLNTLPEVTLLSLERRFSIGFGRLCEREAECKPALRTFSIS